jgi:hypothetical protein
MSLSRAGRCPARLWGALGLIPALLVCAGLGACSTAAPATRSAGWLGVQLPGSMGPTAGARSGPPVEIEDDGLEAQRPPRRSAQPLPDDPSEPFSPNYGPAPAAVAEPAPAPA